MELVAGITFMIVCTAILAIVMWLHFRILHKAGYSGWWCLTLLVPPVYLAVIWVFAFARWPALVGVTETEQRGAKPDRGESLRTGGFDAGGTIVDRDRTMAPELQRAAGPSEVAAWVLSGFDGDGRAVRLEFNMNDLTRNDGLLLGRDPAQCDLVLSDTSISRRHAVFRKSAGQVRCEDLDSANGMYLNGTRAHGADLYEGDTIQIGDVVLVFHEGQ